MIFVGDVAIAAAEYFQHKGFPKSLSGIPLCVNLEGAVTTSQESPAWGVYNSEDWTESFHAFSVGPVFLGNNHIHDLPSGVERTCHSLQSKGLKPFGAGGDHREASQPAHIQSDEINYCLIGAGWPVIGCQPVAPGRPGVNPLDGNILRREIQMNLRLDPSARIVIVLHWNYEFELYPQPGHRRLAMDLIDDGVYAIIGHHPHVVGPIERYKGRTIAYSLGNWAFSYGKHFREKLKFPDASFQQIAVELGRECDLVHHARFSPPDVIQYISTEPIHGASSGLKPEFEGYSHKQYLKWFRSNRIKRRGLPVYSDYEMNIGNRVKDMWVGIRQRLIDSAAKAGLKSMRRKSE
jgi:hypothetical protein